VVEDLGPVVGGDVGENEELDDTVEDPVETDDEDPVEVDIDNEDPVEVDSDNEVSVEVDNDDDSVEVMVDKLVCEEGDDKVAEVDDCVVEDLGPVVGGDVDKDEELDDTVEDPLETDDEDPVEVDNEEDPVEGDNDGPVDVRVAKLVGEEDDEIAEVDDWVVVVLGLVVG
jgi:hypothetical protein